MSNCRFVWLICTSPIPPTIYFPPGKIKTEILRRTDAIAHLRPAIAHVHASLFMGHPHSAPCCQRQHHARLLTRRSHVVCSAIAHGINETILSSCCRVLLAATVAAPSLGDRSLYLLSKIQDEEIFSERMRLCFFRPATSHRCTVDPRRAGAFALCTLLPSATPR